MGYERGFVLSSLIANELNNATTLYYQLLNPVLFIIWRLITQNNLH